MNDRTHVEPDNDDYSGDPVLEAWKAENQRLKAEIENETRSMLCEREGYNYHRDCNDTSCECGCHYEGD